MMRPQLQHIIKEFYCEINERLPPSYQFENSWMWREQVGVRYGQYHYGKDQQGREHTIHAMMMTLERKTLATEFL